jgi:hypothetical protein
VYGHSSVPFVAERDKLDAAFDALPPPKPSLQFYAPSQGGPQAFGAGATKKGFGRLFGSFGSGASPVASSGSFLSSMPVYNSSDAPCFSGECDD